MSVRNCGKLSLLLGMIEPYNTTDMNYKGFGITTLEREKLSLNSHNKKVINTMSKKISLRQAREISELTGTPLENLMDSGMVATPRIGKLEFAPIEVQNAWESLQVAVNEHLEAWNTNLIDEGVTVSEVTLNCKS